MFVARKASLTRHHALNASFPFKSRFALLLCSLDFELPRLDFRELSATDLFLTVLGELGETGGMKD